MHPRNSKLREVASHLETYNKSIQRIREIVKEISTSSNQLLGITKVYKS